MSTFDRIDYSDSPVFWRVSKKVRKDGTVTERLQAVIRHKVRTGIGDDGSPTFKTMSKTKLFPENARLDTDLKRRKAANRWRRELERDEDLRMERERARQEAALEARRAEEERLRREEEDRLAARLPGPRSTVSFYVDSYIDDLEASRSIERTTLMSYRQSAKHISRAFSDTRLEELTPMMVQKWESSLIGEGRHPGSVLKYHKLLSLVCKHATLLEHIQRNPCTLVKTTKQETPLPNSLTANDFSRLASILEFMEPTPVVAAATLAVYTGMRRGEICGLRWREFDTGAMTIRVVESIAIGIGGAYSKAPKTSSGRRTIPVAASLANTLERRRRLMLRQFRDAGVTPTEEEFGRLYVTGDVDGRYQNPLALTKEWRAMSESLGLVGTQGRRVSFHDLRHSFATRAVAAGADVKAVSSVLGHANAAMTLNVYADADPDSKRRTSALVEREAARGALPAPLADLASA